MSVNIREELKSRVTGPRMPQRISAMIVACCFLGLGISFYVHASMGSDPFSTMNLGISSKIGWSFGTWQVLLNAVMLAAIIFIDRSMLGLGTLGNMLLCGYSADFFNIFLDKLLPPTDEMSFAFRIVLTLIGVAMQLFGCSFYITADLGMAPYDCIAYIVQDKTKIHFRVLRIILDCCTVAIGFACGASVGLGTIIMAFCTGPIIPVLNKYVAGPILKTENVRT